MTDFKIFKKAVITEKATAAEKEGKYQFLVQKDATKIAVKQAFKKLYGIDVVRVNVLRTPAKTRMSKTRTPIAKKPEYKKVIITTKGRKTVDISKPKLKI